MPAFPPDPDGRPVFDPASALGWEDVALDGLSCYLRCVESVLFHRGYDAASVAQTLSGPIDLFRRDRSGSDFGSCRVEWANAPRGAHNWDFVVQRMAEGQHAIVMPDRFYWPGDEFEGRAHFHDHMVLAFDLVDDELLVLDTDAPPEQGFVRSIPVTDAVRRACTRIGVVHSPPAPPVRAGNDVARDLLPRSIELLAEDVDVLRRFHADLDHERLPYLLARGFHVVVLGDVQPVLFLFARALVGELSPPVLEVRARAVAAAARAKKLGLLLLALHRFESDRVYVMSARALDALVVALEELLDAMCATEGVSRPPAVETAPDLWPRLLDITEWCFDPDRTVASSFATS